MRVAVGSYEQLVYYILSSSPSLILIYKINMKICLFGCFFLNIIIGIENRYSTAGTNLFVSEKNIGHIEIWEMVLVSQKN